MIVRLQALNELAGTVAVGALIANSCWFFHGFPRDLSWFGNCGAAGRTVPQRLRPRGRPGTSISQKFSDSKHQFRSVSITLDQWNCLKTILQFSNDYESSSILSTQIHVINFRQHSVQTQLTQVQDFVKTPSPQPQRLCPRPTQVLCDHWSQRALNDKQKPRFELGGYSHQNKGVS